MNTASKPFPLGHPGFVGNPIDRAAHLRTDDEKLFALEGKPEARAYVVHRDSIIVKQEESGPRALLTLGEARGFGANPGTVFLGLRNGATVFGMGIPASAVETLVGRNDVTVGDVRGQIVQGALAPDELSTIAIAKSLVSWHQRNGLRQLRHAHR